MANDVFNSIAGVYGWFHRYQMRRFSEILEAHEDRINLVSMHSVCDVGCGTGALCAVLGARGLEVTGVDPAQKMLEVARKKVPDERVAFVLGDAIHGLPFKDKSFDLVFTSHVAHGMPPHERKILYAELMRIAKRAVVVHDYNEERAILTTIVEWLEKGDYFGFIKRPKEEMEETFPSITTIQVGKRANWYVCHCPSHDQGTDHTGEERNTIKKEDL
ncbi:class I SAM-dependent methyltransferase [Pleomorphochaeta sp. DL1XJH-081]|jgi:ubiquinone/menaquinone biosynthesis C-methylase UbiE|uniref:class I SAM-dependent methyltransferase n=1 Tax=Pleomorphochaeta sp. DL1XJH-081 TaxID=3409690 RepID=UPI003BB73CE0